MLPKILVVLLITVGAGFAFRQFVINNPQEIGQFSQENNNEIEVFYEEIPGSKFHSPDATWWGYNQTKIVRFGDIVFSYVIENTDDSNKTASPFVIYKKAGNNPWKKGASFTTSRPGNILIDLGHLHLLLIHPPPLHSGHIFMPHIRYIAHHTLTHFQQVAKYHLLQPSKVLQGI